VQRKMELVGGRGKIAKEVPGNQIRKGMSGGRRREKNLEIKRECGK